MDKNKKMIIGILTAAIVLVVAFIVYITCFDSHIEFSSKFKNGITVEYGKKFEVPKIKAYVRGRLINRKGKEIKCTIDSNVDATKTGSYEIKVNEKYKRDKDGNTLLHYAVKDANFEMDQDLIKLGCCPIIPNFNMETPLILSALSENFNIFKFLIKEFNDILLKEEKNEILAISVSSGNIYHVRLLLEMNYDPNVFYRNTPIILWGVESESTDIIKILCDKNTNLNLADEDGMSALYEDTA